MSDTDGLDLGEATHDAPTDQRQILALSGGGYRGLYTALVLAALESRAGRPLRVVFDVLAGTSIGALIATALALDMPAKEIANAIETHGPGIFDRRIQLGSIRLPVANPTRFLYRARYAREPLAAAIDHIFAEHASTRLTDISTPLLITAINTDTGKPSIFMSRGLDGNAPAVVVKDALLATSAAPTYFPPHVTPRATFVDGGLIANAPDLVAVTETVRKLGCDLNQTRVLSIGTAGSPHIVTAAGREPGVISWLLARGLVQLTLSAQEELTVDQCGVLLGNRFLRLDQPPNPNDSPAGLDRADPNTTQKLRYAADATIQSMATKHRAAIRRFLSHRSQGPRQPPLG